MREPKTFTFNGAKYRITWCSSISGFTDRPEEDSAEPLGMSIAAPAMTFDAFHTIMHEGLEACGIQGLHKKDGTPADRDAARFLWRCWQLGRRRRKKAGK